MNISPSSAPRRGFRLGALALIALSAILVGPVSAANAVPPTVPSADVTLEPESDRVKFLELRVFGSLTPGPKSLVVGPKTKVITVSSPILSASSGFDCRGRDKYGNTFAEKKGQPGRLEVIPGRIVAGLQPFSIECSTDWGGYWSSESATWNALYSSSAPANVVFSDTVAKQTLQQEETRYGAMNPSSPAVIGGRVRAYGPVGTWGSPQAKTATSVLLGTRNVSALSISATRDGAILGFNLPTSILPPGVSVSATSTSVIGETAAAPERRTTTKWTGTIDIVSAYTETTLRLDKTTALSSQAVKATATITTSNGSVPAGPVGFYVDGTKVGTVNMSTNAVGNATFMLRNLKAGPRSVTAKFEGTTPLAASTSPVVKLKIVG